MQVVVETLGACVLLIELEKCTDGCFRLDYGRIRLLVNADALNQEIAGGHGLAEIGDEQRYIDYKVEFIPKFN